MTLYLETSGPAPGFASLRTLGEDAATAIPAALLKRRVPCHSLLQPQLLLHSTATWKPIYVKATDHMLLVALELY